MQPLRKVIWAEGMFLGQQHFQMWDKYHENYRNLQVRSISPLAWGLVSLNIDEEALENAQFRIKSLQAIFQDGRLINYDAAEDEQLSLDLEGGITEKVEIFLCLPVNHAASGINGYQDHGRICSWNADYLIVSDDNDPSREREVMLGRPNIILLRGDESRENFTWIKLAEVVNEGDGRFSLVEDYVPPITRIGVSKYLNAMLLRIIELFSAKVRILNERRMQHSASAAGFGHNDITNFLILQTLSGALPLLQHYRKNSDLHPENVYKFLVRIIGSLCPFSFDVDVHDVKTYEHGNLREIFSGIEQQLRALLDVAMPSKLEALKLVKEADALYSLDNIDSTLLESSCFYLAVLSDSDDPSWVTHFEKMVKAGARKDVEMIVASALPGIRIVHTQRPPSNLPIKSGYEYFKLEPRGEFWDAVVEERTLGVFLSRDFSNVKLEILSIQD